MKLRKPINLHQYVLIHWNVIHPMFVPIFLCHFRDISYSWSVNKNKSVAKDQKMEFWKMNIHTYWTVNICPSQLATSKYWPSKSFKFMTKKINKKYGEMYVILDKRQMSNLSWIRFSMHKNECLAYVCELMCEYVSIETDLNIWQVLVASLYCYSIQSECVSILISKNFIIR